jgi:hypothetical protein
MQMPLRARRSRSWFDTPTLYSWASVRAGRKMSHLSKNWERRESFVAYYKAVERQKNHNEPQANRPPVGIRTRNLGGQMRHHSIVCTRSPLGIRWMSSNEMCPTAANETPGPHTALGNMRIHFILWNTVGRRVTSQHNNIRETMTSGEAGDVNKQFSVI